MGAHSGSSEGGTFQEWGARQLSEVRTRRAEDRVTVASDIRVESLPSVPPHQALGPQYTVSGHVEGQTPSGRWGKSCHKRQEGRLAESTLSPVSWTRLVVASPRAEGVDPRVSGTQTLEGYRTRRGRERRPGVRGVVPAC